MKTGTSSVTFEVVVDTANGFGIGVESNDEKFITGPFETMTETQEKLDQLVSDVRDNGRFVIQKVTLQVDPLAMAS